MHGPCSRSRAVCRASESSPLRMDSPGPAEPAMVRGGVSTWVPEAEGGSLKWSHLRRRVGWVPVHPGWTRRAHRSGGVGNHQRASRSSSAPRPCLGCSVHGLAQHTESGCHMYSYSPWNVRGHRLPLPAGLSKSELLTGKALPPGSPQGLPFLPPAGDRVPSSVNVCSLCVRGRS